MAHVRRPHDRLFRTVFADHAEAAALLRAYLPEEIARDLRWSTLALQDRSFVDPDLLDTESDLLFSIRRKAGAPPAWLYVLLEHQSRPDRWIRFRLRATLSGSGGDQVTYAEELVQEMARKVRAEGMLEGQVGTIESLVRAGHRPGRLACSQAATRTIGRRDERSRLKTRGRRSTRTPGVRMVSRDRNGRRTRRECRNAPASHRPRPAVPNSSADSVWGQTTVAVSYASKDPGN